MAFVRFALLSVAALVALPAGAAKKGDAKRGAALFQQRCSLCHHTDDQAGQGPGLGGVVGRKAASTEFPYTPALETSHLTWTRANLDKFLQAPAELVPGTAMVVRVIDDQERSDLVAYLATLKGRRKK